MVNFCGVIRVEDRSADVGGGKVVRVSSTATDVGVEDTCESVAFETMLME